MTPTQQVVDDMHRLYVGVCVAFALGLLMILLVAVIVWRAEVRCVDHEERIRRLEPAGEPDEQLAGESDEELDEELDEQLDEDEDEPEPGSPEHTVAAIDDLVWEYRAPDHLEQRTSEPEPEPEPAGPRRESFDEWQARQDREFDEYMANLASTGREPS